MGQESHLAGRVWSEVPSRRPRRSLEAFLEYQEGSVGPSEGPGGAGGPEEAGRHSHKGQEWSESLSESWEGSKALPEGRVGSRSTPERPEGIGRPPRGTVGVSSPSLVGREGSEGPSYGMAGARRGREALSERPIRWAMRGWQWSVGPPGGL